MFVAAWNQRGVAPGCRDASRLPTKRGERVSRTVFAGSWKVTPFRRRFPAGIPPCKEPEMYLIEGEPRSQIVPLRGFLPAHCSALQ